MRPIGTAAKLIVQLCLKSQHCLAAVKQYAALVAMPVLSHIICQERFLCESQLALSDGSMQLCSYSPMIPGKSDSPRER